MTEECLGGTHLPIGWEEIRDWFTKPRKGRVERKSCPGKERGATETGDSGGQADEVGGSL